MEHEEYKIDSFEKLCNVISEENFESLTTDLILWLKFHVLTMKEFREKYPKETKKKTNWQICKSTFIWVNDGKHDLKHVEITNAKTGKREIIEFSEQKEDSK